MTSSRKTIILVDDSQANLTQGRYMLSTFYHVIPVPSGKKLFEVLEKVIPAIILLDIEMPEM
ncbi:MAG: hypothetical protein FWG21_05850, partial [Oscillospiraceae bacterium]|nr:hypothetical protein [Oscillospiraceae bacterium]